MKSAKFRDPVYRANHRRLHRERGRARDHDCTRCSGPAAQWAQLHDRDGSDPWADYEPMCCKCHVIYDRGGIPRPWSPEARRNLSEAKKGWNPRPETRAAMSVSARARQDRRRDPQTGKWVKAT